jgi:hypothetical protein
VKSRRVSKVTRGASRAVTRRQKPALRAKSHASPATARKSSTVTAKKSGAAARTRSGSRSHHKQRQIVPHPMPMRHDAPVRPVLVAPARSMPPTREQRKATAPAPARPPMVVPDFNEAGVILAITYSIRDGRRNEFFDLMKELKPLLSGIGGNDCTVYEDRSRSNYFMEVFRFKDEAEFTAFDDKFHKDRKIAAIYALLDDIVEAEKSDFKIFERRL